MRNRLPETGRSFIRLCLSSPKLGEPRIARNLCLLLQCIEKIADLVGPFQRILAENRPQKFQQLNRETLGNTIFTHEERSAEHTYELQSLMRNSYAVFCLKKTTKKN